MSVRRRLQTGAERNGPQSSPAPARSRPSNPNEPIPFPEYTPPTCPLSIEAQQAIANIRTLHSNAKIKKHITAAIKNLTDTTVTNNDRMWERKRQVEKNARKREKEGRENEEFLPEHKDLENHTRHMEKKVKIWTDQAEIAMRVLIDKGDEVERNDMIIRDVCNKLADAIPVNANRGIRAQDEERPDVEIISAVELLDQIKEEYKTKYEAESMTKRYASHNDYKSFKRVVHDSLHPDQDVPLPKESTWFPSDRSHPSTQNNARDEDESSDDEIVIAKIVKDLKCPLTYKTFCEPYTNKICDHSFEKKEIIEYHRKNATLVDGERVVRCPAVGCDNRIAMKDMFDDLMLLRQVKRVTQRDDDSDDESDNAPRETHRSRVQESGEENNVIDANDEERRRGVPSLTQVSTDGEDEDDDEE